MIVDPEACSPDIPAAVVEAGEELGVNVGIFRAVDTEVEALDIGIVTAKLVGGTENISPVKEDSGVDEDSVVGVTEVVLGLRMLDVAI